MMPVKSVPLEQHNTEIQENLRYWESKPLLRKIYRGFHEQIAKHVTHEISGTILELGSGIGNIKEVIPNCLRTDLFPNPWLDQTEDAYRLSCGDNSVSNIILFDVFHHLRHPGNAFAEFKRVLKPGGRVIIFDPCMSLLGLLVYGVLHHEPIAINDKIEWNAPPGWSPDNDSYYAAQGNAYRIFYGGGAGADLSDFKIVKKKRLSCISYVASGGYSKPQMYPDSLYPVMQLIDGAANLLPWIFATRLLVVLERIR